jgi:DNA-binding transcriptional regulator YdaS (Cro superfamily)
MENFKNDCNNVSRTCRQTWRTAVLRRQKQKIREEGKLASKNLLIDIITLAGSQARLARLCGVSDPTVWDWVRNGISRRGAVLVSRSQEFFDIVSYQDLRPDMRDDRAYRDVLMTKRYRDARIQQRKFEESKEFEEKSPRAALERLLGASNGNQKNDKE